MVKQQVIARYLTAEKEAAAMPASSVAVTPANYKFRYLASSGGTPVYAFQITPRHKRTGLIKGELWIDGATGLAVHEAGYLVKKPSIFIRRLKITRDVSLSDGVPYLRTTHLDIDVRFAGRAELTIIESPCVQPLSTIIAAQESMATKDRTMNACIRAIKFSAFALSRDIPRALRWLIDRIVKRVSRSSLLTRLSRAAVRSEVGVSNASSDPAALSECRSK